MSHVRIYTSGDVPLTPNHKSLELRKDVQTEGLESKVVCISMLTEAKRSGSRGKGGAGGQRVTKELEEASGRQQVTPSMQEKGHGRGINKSDQDKCPERKEEKQNINT